MNPDVLIPSVDALPLPGPIWLFKFLLHLTFVLHLVFMNFLLGGGVIAAVERVRGSAGGPGVALARRVERMLPATMAFTVTLGVAPLLFVQAMYGHLFYTSSVIMAWPWFLVVPILIALYYVIYAISFKGSESAGWVKPWGWIFSLGLLLIAFIYVNNMSLALRPESWAQKYFADPSGMNANLGDVSLVPRYLHMIIAAFAVGGLIVAVLGSWFTKDADHARHAVRVGAWWFLGGTGLQYIVGFWFLMALPREVMMRFMGGSGFATTLLGLSVVLPLVAMYFMSTAMRRTDTRQPVLVSSVFILVTIVFMVLARDVVRDAMLAPYFDVNRSAIQSQTGVFLIFAVLLVGGLATVVWMLRVFALQGRSGSSS